MVSEGLGASVVAFFLFSIPPVMTRNHVFLLV
jgi:hypothetical protein